MGNAVAPIVRTRAGKLEGCAEDGLFVFRGVRYAEPPVGPRRWMAPEPVKPWDGVQPAKGFGSVAPQQEQPITEIQKSILLVREPHSEDCLFLNVWTPGLDDARRPVMMWIHPGGWEFGAGSQPNYDGSAPARRGDVVVVTINFRLGALGFLNLNEVTGGKIPSTGNEGTLDHIAALQWINENIAAFGGDPDNVTVFGSSSGAAHVATLLATPLAEGLIHRAILQSVGAHTAHTVENATRVARLLLKQLDLDPRDVDGLRAVPPEKFAYATMPLIATMREQNPELGIMHYHSVVDGKVLFDKPIDALRKGASSNVPVLAGTNLDEKRIGLGSETPSIAAGSTVPMPLEESHIPALLGLGPQPYWTQELVETYRISRQKHGEPSEPLDLLIAIETDRVLRMPTIRVLEAKQSHRRPGYGYLFTWKSPVLGGRLRACHSLENPFIFGTYDDSFCGSGPDADTMARNMQDAWSAFARNGNPSCESVGEWPSYGEHRETMILDKTCELVNAPFDDERRAWDDIPDHELALM